MNYYEIVNPSDAYTMKCDNDRVAIAAVAILGEGKYGLTKYGDDAFKCPFGLFGGATVYDESLGMPIIEFIESHKQQIADALGTVLIGDLNSRIDLEKALEGMDESKREVILAERHDRRRSSMNNIGARAAELSKLLKGKR